MYISYRIPAECYRKNKQHGKLPCVDDCHNTMRHDNTVLAGLLRTHRRWQHTQSHHLTCETNNAPTFAACSRAAKSDFSTDGPDSSVCLYYSLNPLCCASGAIGQPNRRGYIWILYTSRVDRKSSQSRWMGALAIVRATIKHEPTCSQKSETAHFFVSYDLPELNHMLGIQKYGCEIDTINVHDWSQHVRVQQRTIEPRELLWNKFVELFYVGYDVTHVMGVASWQCVLPILMVPSNAW